MYEDETEPEANIGADIRQEDLRVNAIETGGAKP